ncbi:hypothetical protein IW140_001981 [Coemansia sp. RSA 1813]|nr:hypothetical protein EV178_005559 [Coemansia sp. RSA 1646]KAJ1771599.1 hypothetical protein LPJ74_002153 [Coemansia sp. RSA 1843]KAJ2215219.1 hypothetical protein EV179_002306 [Coemansia sp. RSA 487]KAJ2571026.1 hypothetical protein IW140_001981 [Coemansia sp. RSA 1813]
MPGAFPTAPAPALNLAAIEPAATVGAALELALVASTAFVVAAAAAALVLAVAAAIAAVIIIAAVIVIVTMVTTTAPDAVAPPSLAAPGTLTDVVPLPITAPKTVAVVSPGTYSIGVLGNSASNVPASLAAPVSSAADTPGTSDDVALGTAAADAFASLDDDTSNGSLLSELYEINQHAEEQLAIEKAAVDELLSELKTMATVTDTLESDLSLARANAAKVNSRAKRAEILLHDQQKENKKQSQKIEALSELVLSLASWNSSSLPSPAESHVSNNNSSDSDTSDRQEQYDPTAWRSEHARMVSAIGVLHARCTLARPESQMSPSVRRDLAIVESYLERTTHADSLDISISNKVDNRDMLAPPTLPSSPLEELCSDSDTSDSDDYDLPTSSYDMPPQQSWMAEQEERLSRRRSSLLYADLIRPSACLSVSPRSKEALGKQPAYGWCSPLLGTLQAPEIDGDCFDMTNTMPRGKVAKVVSRYNALVNNFECERTQRMDAHNHKKLEAQQHTEIIGSAIAQSR